MNAEISLSGIVGKQKTNPGTCLGMKKQLWSLIGKKKTLTAEDYEWNGVADGSQVSSAIRDPNHQL